MRVGLVGVGVAGTSHLFDLVTDDRFEVVAVCAATRRRAEDVARTFGVPHASDADALFDEQRPDAIVLATPPAVTPRLLQRVVAAGLPVLVEKPAAATAEELRAVLASAVRRGRGAPPVSVAYNRRYQRHVHEAKRIVAAGRLGTLTEVECRWYAPFRQRYTAGDTYRRHVRRGHGVVLDTGCHVLDTLLFLGLGPLSVTAARLAVAGPPDSGPDVEAHLNLTGGEGVTVAVHVEEGVEEVWQLTIRGVRGSLALTRSRLVLATDGCTDRIEQDYVARPVEDLLRMRSGLPPHGASLSEATRCLTVVDAVRTAASVVRKPWLRPRAKALGRLNGSC